jgi:hypothetical protein
LLRVRIHDVVFHIEIEAGILTVVLVRVSTGLLLMSRVYLGEYGQGILWR